MFTSWMFYVSPQEGLSESHLRESSRKGEERVAVLDHAGKSGHQELYMQNMLQLVSRNRSGTQQLHRHISDRFSDRFPQIYALSNLFLFSRKDTMDEKESAPVYLNFKTCHSFGAPWLNLTWILRNSPERHFDWWIRITYFFSIRTTDCPLIVANCLSQKLHLCLVVCSQHVLISSQRINY